MVNKGTLLDTILGISDQHIVYVDDNIEKVSEKSAHGVHHLVLKQLQAMVEHAKKDGFSLTIASSFRDFERQLSIFNRKVNGQLNIYDDNNQIINPSELDEEALISAILHFSALPGASRHHWGTDFDFYDKSLLPENSSLALAPWEYQEGGYFYALTCWLNKYAGKYGFYRPYSEYKGGVAIEPWHFSYFPIASEFQQALSISTLKKQLLESNILLKETIINNINSIYLNYVINVAEPPNV